MNKKNIKKISLRLLLGLEIIVFGFTYLFGNNGLYFLKDLDLENQQLSKDITQLKAEIMVIENGINEWNKDPFYKEQLAREKLQMARENETIYFIE